MPNSPLTVREVARACGRSEETVRRWIWSGKLRAQKLGNQLFVERADVQAMQVPRAGEAKTRYVPGGRRSVQPAKGSAAKPAPGAGQTLECPPYFGRVLPKSESTVKLFRDYDYSPVVEDLREHRGQILPSHEEEARHIAEVEAFQDELAAKFGPVDVVDLLRQVREA